MILFMAHPSVTDSTIENNMATLAYGMLKLIVSMCWHDIEFNVIIMGNYRKWLLINYIYMYSVYLSLHAVYPGFSSQGCAT